MKQHRHFGTFCYYSNQHCVLMQLKHVVDGLRHCNLLDYDSIALLLGFFCCLLFNKIKFTLLFI